jgi:hypothetical protein
LQEEAIKKASIYIEKISVQFTFPTIAVTSLICKKFTFLFSFYQLKFQRKNRIMDTENLIIIIFGSIWMIGLLCCAASLHCDCCDEENNEIDRDGMELAVRFNNLTLRD